MRSIQYLCIALLLIASVVAATSSPPVARQVELINESGESVAVDWMHPVQGPVPFEGNLAPGEHLGIDTFENTTFAIRYPNSNTTNTVAKTDTCAEQGTCSTPSPTLVTITDQEEQVIVVKQGLKVTYKEPATQNEPEAVGGSESSQIVEACHSKSLENVEQDPTQALDTLLECLQAKTADLLERKNADLAQEATLRTDMAAQMENYTCADVTRETSKPIATRPWIHDGVVRQPQILHDRPSSQIHVIPDFISPEECQAIQEKAAPSLHRGTVADGKGGSRLSDSRKAWQAGVSVDWTTDNPIARVSQRLFDYTNDAVGYNLSVVGQEDIMSIQYFGNGPDEPSPDRYMMHCDGDCDGTPLKKGGRVATMVMYCDAPDVGGGTNFANSNVYVKPQVGAAAFFSYLHPETHIHEHGFTTHSGCPVVEGTKRIAVQWMRIGVDEENPWDSFDTNTISIKQKDDDDADVVEDDVVEEASC